MLELNQQYVFLSVDQHNFIRTKMIQADVHHRTASKSTESHKDKFQSSVWKSPHHTQASFEVGIRLFLSTFRELLKFHLKNT